MKLYSTTIAIKFNDGENKCHWSTETYPRVIRDTEIDFNFEYNFIKAYAGNGIEDIKILESDFVTYVDLNDIANGKIFTQFDKMYSDYNKTILEF